MYTNQKNQGKLAWQRNTETDVHYHGFSLPNYVILRPLTRQKIMHELGFLIPRSGLSPVGNSAIQCRGKAGEPTDYLLSTGCYYLPRNMILRLLQIQFMEKMETMVATGDAEAKRELAISSPATHCPTTREESLFSHMKAYPAT